jgi:hypothetical protein
MAYFRFDWQVRKCKERRHPILIFVATMLSTFSRKSGCWSLDYERLQLFKLPEPVAIIISVAAGSLGIVKFLRRSPMVGDWKVDRNGASRREVGRHLCVVNDRTRACFGSGCIMTTNKQLRGEQEGDSHVP